MRREVPAEEDVSRLSGSWEGEGGDLWPFIVKDEIRPMWWGVFSLWVYEGSVGLRLVYLMGFVVYIVVYIWSGWKVGFVRLFEKSESTCPQYLGMWCRYMWTSS